MKKLQFKVIVLVMMFGISLFGIMQETKACTLFAATGADYVVNSGTLMAKNRDEKPALQTLNLLNRKPGIITMAFFRVRRHFFV